MSKTTRPKGVADHPAKDQMEAIWRGGGRAKQIVAWLEEQGLPPVSEKTVARYGQRFWTEKVTIRTEDAEPEELNSFLNEIESAGLGVVTKIGFSKKKYPGWEKIDGQNVQVDKESVAQTIEITPVHVPQLSPARLPDIHISSPYSSTKSSRSRSKAPRSRSKPPGWSLAVVIPDPQIGFHRGTDGALTATHDEQALNICHQIALDLETDYGIDTWAYLGDNLDFASFTNHRSAPGYTGNTQLEIDRFGTEVAVARSIAQDAEIVVLAGNHDCLSEDTLAITEEGLKPYSDLEVGEKILSCNDAQEPVWLPIQAVHVYDYEGPMYKIGSAVNMLATPNHRVVGFPITNYHPGKGNWKESLAGKLSRTNIPVACINNKPDLPGITDEEIRLIAWGLSDSHVNDWGYWTFYQRESKVQRLLDLLDHFGMEYRLYRRERDITEICGKVLKKKPEASYDVSVCAEDSKNIISPLIDSKDYLPDVLWNLSSRQVEVFLDEMVYTDGSIPTRGDEDSLSRVIYHSRDTRYDLQMLFLLNGISCSLTEYRPSHWRLNICKRPVRRVDASSVSPEQYSGKVWCVTVENGRFFASRDGHPFLTGNSRLSNTLVDKVPHIVGISKANTREPVLSIANLCRFDEYNIKYVESYPDGEYWLNDYLRLEHGTAVSGTPGGTAAKHLNGSKVSTIFGHTHRQELVWTTINERHGARDIFAGTPGTTARVDGVLPSGQTGITSKGTQAGKKNEKWQQGLFIVWYQTGGAQEAIPEPVKIRNGKALYNGRIYEATVTSNGEKLV